MRSLLRPLVVGAALLAAPLAPLAVPLAAQAPAAKPPVAKAPAAKPVSHGGDPSTATGLRKELIAQLADAESKLVQLAEAMPQDKYAWRPGPGVRSVSEVFMHMVGANYLIPPFAGVPRAQGLTLTQDSERTVTDKAAVVDHLKKSFAYAKQAMMDVPDADMDAAVQLFGQPSTKRGVLVLMATHAHEHLGQAIAYARANGVRPPWSPATGGDH
ncbi:DinB family protein [Roseisolibacter agri]|nr:DinB family protein [Roseisolibacter agri]